MDSPNQTHLSGPAQYAANGRTEGSARILVTDDEAAMRSIIVRVLGDRYVCDEAADVPEARERLEQEEYALVLCDIHLPGESGWTLAEEILERHPSTAVVFLTGEGDMRLAQDAINLGAFGYMVKPFERGQLLITVMNALKRRDLELAEGAHKQALERQLQTVIDRSPLSIYIKDRDLRFIAINRAGSVPSGLEPEELIGKTVDVFMTPEAALTSREGDLRVFESGEAYEAEETLTMSGTMSTLRTVKFPLLGEDGEVQAVCGISQDITAEKEAQRLHDELVRTQRRSIDELRQSRRETVALLARTVELRDGETGAHVTRMARVTAFLAALLGMDEVEMDLLQEAAVMHDVGKIGIPDEILLKPGSLTEEERKAMQLHTTIGGELLANSDTALLRLAATIALTHHEHWDGTGYPRGLAGESIPLEGRIVAVADVFDALLSDRPYRPAMELDRTLEIIREGRGTHFDPAVVDMLLAHVDETCAIRERG